MYVLKSWGKMLLVAVVLSLAASASATEAMVNALKQKFPLAEVSEVSTTNYLVRLTADCGPVTLSGSIGGLTLDLNGHSITGKNGATNAVEGTALLLDKKLNVALKIEGPGEIVGGNSAPKTVGGYGIYNAYYSIKSYKATVTVGSGVLVCGGRGGDNPAGRGADGGRGLDLKDRYANIINYGTIKGGKGGTGVPRGGQGGASAVCVYNYVANYGTLVGGDGGDGEIPGASGLHGGWTKSMGTMLSGSYGENTCIYSMQEQLGATLTTLALTNHVLTLNEDAAGPIWIPPIMGRLTLDMNGHSITGQSFRAEITEGAALVVTGAFVGVNSPTTLQITGTGSIVGGAGAAGKPGAAGIYVATEGVNGWDLISLGAGVTVRGGAGGDNPSGVGGAGGAGVYYLSDPVYTDVLKYYSMVSLRNAGAIYGGAGGAGTTGGGDGGYGVYRRGVCLVYENASGDGFPVSVFSNTGTVEGGDGGIGGQGAAKPGLGGAWTDVLGHGDWNSGTVAHGAPGSYDLASVDNIYTNQVSVERTSTDAEDPRDRLTLGMVGWTVDAADANGRATAVRTMDCGIAGSGSGMARMTMDVVGSGAVTFGSVVRSPTVDGGRVAALAIYVDGVEVRRLEEASAVPMGGLREENVEVVVSGDGNADHVVELEYEQAPYCCDFQSTCAIGGVKWRSYRQMDDGGTTWLDITEAAPVVIVDHEQASPNVTHLAFQPKLKVPGELEYWIRRSAEKDADGRSRICVKLGRTRKECTAATPIDAELRDFGEDIPEGARDLGKGIVWLTVTLPENVVQPVGYWRVYLRPSKEVFAPEHAQRPMAPTSFRVHYLETGTGMQLAEPRTYTNQSVGTLVRIPWYAVDVGRDYALDNDPNECALLTQDPAQNEYICWYSHPTTTTFTARFMNGESDWTDFYTDIDAPRVIPGLDVGSAFTYDLFEEDKWYINYWNCMGWIWFDTRELDWIDELNAVFYFYYDCSPQ